MRLLFFFFILMVTLFASNIPHFIYESAINPASNAFVKKAISVVVYVSPKGARADSAGTYILYASHIAAMTQSSYVGEEVVLEAKRD